MEIPEKCERCGEKLEEPDYITDIEFDVHEYEVIIGYYCPECGYHGRI